MVPHPLCISRPAVWPSVYGAIAMTIDNIYHYSEIYYLYYHLDYHMGAGSHGVGALIPPLNLDELNPGWLKYAIADAVSVYSYIAC